MSDEAPIVKFYNEEYEPILFLPKGSERVGEGGLRKAGYFKNNVKDAPLISVVTVVFNGEKFLEETILSVINQEYINVEYIIIDGGSTDGCLDIIRKYQHAIDYWVSEADGGIYDAMNKGIRLCRGEIIGIINSGDHYTENCFSAIKKYFSSDFDVLTGALYKYSSDLRVGFIAKSNSENIDDVLKYMPISHPATFVTQEAYKKHGLFDDYYKICGDNELIARLYKAGCKFKFLDDILAVMRTGGVSEQMGTILLMAKEHYHLRKDNEFPIFNNLMITLYYILAKSFKKVASSILPKKIMRTYYEAKNSES
ncbi:glycosyltransferase family 2 protein [Halomonas rhizosphaerae]|uniref:Glycosyltransferase family 2 protein n=1 Tax=Halomonas rhizosphaerae TaxID=3043296 RepID=A0ABT6UWD7_9GAMM|nr:glycosyltransferase family 2 protein [Halomonas rhizosphaerae]MDI5890281.1 glycosyltransferase family 2 protein [Halomonas rhizosphaerae]